MPAGFYLDTSVLNKKGHKRLCQKAHEMGIRVVVPALAHAERIAQLRREKGADFDPGFIRSYLETLGIEILPFTISDAERAAEWLSRTWPSPESWLAAKKSLLKKCFGEKALELEVTKRSCGAPLDLYIAAAPPLDFVVVSEDQGFEWSSCPVRRVTLSQALIEMDSMGACSP